MSAESRAHLLAKVYSLIGLEERALRLEAESRPGDHWPLLNLYNLYRRQGKEIPKDLEEPILRARIRTMIAPGELIRYLREIYIKSGRNLSDMDLRDICTPNRTCEKVFYCFALPKSASRAMMQLLIAGQGEGGIRDALPPYAHGSPGLAATMELRFEYLSACRGGWFHSHAAPTPATLQVLDRLEIRHTIALRHPADHVAALYCHLRGQYPEGTKAVPPSETAAPLRNSLDKLRLRQRWHNVIHPVSEMFFSSKVAVNDAIDHLINDGYLVSALKWMVDWQSHSNPSLAYVVRYENLMRDSETILTDAYRFLRQRDPVAPMHMPVPKETFDPAVYPRGYTREIGIYRQYFSRTNIDDYNRVVRSFLETTRMSRGLIELYPDVLI